MNPELYNNRFTLKPFREMNAILEKSFSDKTGASLKKAICDAVNGRTEIQMGHSGLLRGDKKRMLELVGAQNRLKRIEAGMREKNQKFEAGMREKNQILMGTQM